MSKSECMTAFRLQFQTENPYYLVELSHEKCYRIIDS